MLYFVWMPNGADSLSVGGHVGIELKRDSRVILSVSVMWHLALKLDSTERDVKYESFLCVYKKEGFLLLLLLFCLFLFCFRLNVNFYEQSLMRSWPLGLGGYAQTLPPYGSVFRMLNNSGPLAGSAFSSYMFFSSQLHTNCMRLPMKDG